MNKQQLHQAFLETNYRVFLSNDINIDNKIGQFQPELEKYFTHLKTWAFIAAWNPLPDVLDLDSNKKRDLMLEADLKNLDLMFARGIGISNDQTWQEESFFILNCTLKTAHELAFKYGQLAFVFGEKSTPCELHYTEKH